MADIAIFRINYKSDFILTLQSDAGWMTPFCIKFWTGAPSKAYYAYYDGMSYTHCTPVEGEPTKLLVQFDDHHLPIGNLKFQIGYHFTVADFPTSIEDEVINQAAVIIEVDDAPAQVMLDFNGETAPEIQFALPAYVNEAQRIANEQARIAAEEQRISNEEARIAAEETRQQNEQQRISREQQRIEQEQQRVNAEAERVSEFASLKTESEAATAAANIAATLANEKAQLADDKAALAQAAATLANEKAQLAEDKANLAQQKADYAQTQGNYAKAQGDAAKTEAEAAHSLNEEVSHDEATRQQQEAARQQAEAQRVIDFNAQMQQQQTAYTEAEAARETAFDEAETERDAKVDAKVADITNLQAQIGYFVCDTNAATAAKTIAATGYVLGTGGSIKVKMTNDNTVNNATLNINSTGAKPLFYEGARASSTNTWAANDVLEIYYDGTNYQANNVSPTFKTGEKVNSVGVDDEPTAGSDNLVKSGGVYKSNLILSSEIWNKYHRTFPEPFYKSRYFSIENNSVVIHVGTLWNIYLIELSDLDMLVTLAGNNAIPAFCHLSSKSINSYITDSEVYGDLDVTNRAFKGFVGKVIPVTGSNYVLVNAFVGTEPSLEMPYGYGYMLDNDLEDRFVSIENSTQNNSTEIYNINKNLLQPFKTSDICQSVGYFTINDSSIVVNLSNNWRYGIYPLAKIKILEANAWNLFPVCAFLSGDSIEDYIVGSEIMNTTLEHKATIILNDSNVPQNATHIIINNQAIAVDNLFYKESPIKNYYVLDSSGNGDFTTIEEALNLADKNSTIFVKNGEYSLLKANGQKVEFRKGLTWIGENRETTIFSYYSGKYGHAPITHSGIFENITFLSGYKEGVSPSVAPESTGYCVHVDFMKKEEDVYFGVTFDNCHFKAYWNTAVGCGMRKDFVLEIHNCFIENLIDDNPVMDGIEHPNKRYRFACISSHCVANTEDPELIGSGTVKLHNNRLLSTKPSVITLQDNVGNSDYPVIWEFIGNSCYSEDNQYNCVFSSASNAFISQWDNTGKLLSPLSWGNNINMLNCQINA